MRRTFLSACFLLFAQVSNAADAFWGERKVPLPLREESVYLSEQKIFDGDGWPLRVPKESWSAAKTTVMNDPQWSKWLSERRRLSDSWIERHQDRPELVVGWAHDFVRADGTPMQWAVDSPPVFLPGDAGSKKLREAWNYTFRLRHIEQVQEAARLFRLTGSSQYADWVVSQLDFYSENYSKWPLQTRLGRSRLMGQSLDEAVVVIMLADAARLVKSVVPDGKFRAWSERLFVPIAESLLASLQGVNNISCWQLSAVGVVAVTLGDEVLLSRALDGPNGIRNLLRRGITSDRVWYEGSMGYNSYVIRSLLPLFESLALSGRGSYLVHEMLRAQNLMLAPLTLRFQDDTLPNPGDVIGRIKVPDLALYIDARRILPTRIGVRGSMKIKNWGQLIDPPSSILASASDETLPKVSSVVFSDTRMAVLKGEYWQIFEHWGQAVENHSQREALNVEAFVLSRPFSRDPGTVNYGSAAHSQYYSQPAAHNVPFSDDRGQVSWSPGELLKFDSRGTLSVRQPAYNSNLDATRTLSVKGADFIDEVFLAPRFGAKAPKTVGLTWHFDCKLIGFDRLQPALLAFPKTDGFEFWRDVRGYQLTNFAELMANCSGRTITVRFEVVGNFVLFKGIAPGMKSELRDAVYIRVDGGTAKIRSTFGYTESSDR